MNFKEVFIKPIPYLRIFLLLFIVINFIGIINFPFYTDKLDYKPLFTLVLVGFFGFLLGTLLIRFINFNIRPAKGTFKPKLFIFIFWISFILSHLLIIYTHISNRGIILFLGSERYTAYTIITLFSYTSIILLLLYFAYLQLNNKKIGKEIIILFLIQGLSAISMGYRTPFLILFSCAFLIFIVVRNNYHSKYKNLFSPKYILLFLILVMAMSYISTFRVSQDYDVERYFRNIDSKYIDNNVFLKPYMSTLSVFRYDQEVVTTLIKKTKGNHYYGELAVSNILTLLPGAQLGARNKIGEIIEARKFPDGKPWSITPTLQGALYVDGGMPVVFIGFFILAALIEFLKKFMISRKDPFSVVLYALLAVNSVMLIHTGYFDVLVFILIGLILILQFITMRIRYVV